MGILRLCNAKCCRDLHWTRVPTNGAIPAPRISVLPSAAAALGIDWASYQHRLGCMDLGAFLGRGWSLADDFATSAVGWAAQSFHMTQQWDFSPCPCMILFSVFFLFVSKVLVDLPASVYITVLSKIYLNCSLHYL